MRKLNIPLFIIALGLFLLKAIGGYAQRYAFSHYEIEDGLIQSQVNKLVLDNTHRLWIATLGGACRFDGKDFISYTKAKGLESNFVYSLFSDKSNRVWFGTNNGLSYLNHDSIYNSKIPSSVTKRWVTNIVQDVTGKIWAHIGSNLFSVKGSQVEADETWKNRPISAITIDKNGKLWVSVNSQDLYKLEKNTWIHVLAKLPGKESIRQLLFDKIDPNKYFILTAKNIYQIISGNIQTLATAGDNTFLTIEEDEQDQLWLGTFNGAGCFKNNNWVWFNAGNGFTDNAVTQIYNDKDNNLWFATNGDGFYKFQGDNYAFFGKDQGLIKNAAVMGLTLDKANNILLGTDGGGVFRFDGAKIKNIWLPPSTMQNAANIECFYKDKNGVIWIGTRHGGLWQYDNNKFNLMLNTYGYTISAIAIDDEKTLWVGTPLGCRYIQHGKITEIPGINSFCASILLLGKDSVLVGSQTGPRLIINKKIDTKFNLPELNNVGILCMLRYKDNIIYGSSGSGLYLYNLKTKIIKLYTTKDGLNSNIIYSLAVDSRGIVWAGTERGTNRLIVNSKNITCDILPYYLPKSEIFEANQNAMLLVKDKMWIGNSKGVSVIDTRLRKENAAPPYTIIQSAQYFQPNSKHSNDPNKVIRGDILQDNATLSYKQNHITISYIGAYLKNPQSIVYKYKMVGLDSDFSAPVSYSTVDYPALPPGKYKFVVTSLTKNGLNAVNNAAISFEILSPFYQTLLFKLTLILAFILLGVGLKSYYDRKRLKDKMAVELIKTEEQLRLRVQTAEDFHDDLGNRLTRINVLTDILNTKIDADKADQRRLVNQIKQNVEALYNGTKDILWALDPANDNLHDLLLHIKDFGAELFMDTDVNFMMEKPEIKFKQIKLAMQESRNLNLIFKELLNNVLKHAEATSVLLTVSCLSLNEINIIVTDDGKGFDINSVKRGQGLNNIFKRINRINATLNINATTGGSTSFELNYKPAKLK
ncbi:MAG: hypothetical protein JWQ34_3137 [Mucilaginibacter sp.]|uniref:ligand-binding sensor domain-containing protein n=1 Tax=Mucilaginibacter sp. TaxID=1882438 RepID=UPI002610A619|nr:sensor histidine kinase [Mucilaginibacter sp.]MDB5004912.1 hypothetical protein [Mucilaginibacter sp.]